MTFCMKIYVCNRFRFQSFRAFALTTINGNTKLPVFVRAKWNLEYSECTNSVPLNNPFSTFFETSNLPSVWNWLVVGRIFLEYMSSVVSVDRHWSQEAFD